MNPLLENKCDECEEVYEIYDLENIAGTNFIICKNCFNKALEGEE